MTTPAPNPLRAWLEDAMIDTAVEAVAKGGREAMRRLFDLCRRDAFLQAAQAADNCPTKTATGAPCSSCAGAAARIRGMT